MFKIGKSKQKAASPIAATHVQQSGFI